MPAPGRAGKAGREGACVIGVINVLNFPGALCVNCTGRRSGADAASVNGPALLFNRDNCFHLRSNI